VRFLAGLLVGLVAGAAATYLILGRRAPAPAPAAVTPAPPPEPPRKPRRPQAPRPSAPAGPVELTAADRVMASEGDALRAGETTLDMAGGAEPRNLTQEEIDGAIARRSQGIIRCITDARGGAELEGRIQAGVVVDAAGRVVKTRVEAPAYLLHHGLGACVRAELASLRFPAAGRETVVTVPFNLANLE
jgi:hypothetical protein